jgi:hypothetical protein
VVVFNVLPFKVFPSQVISLKTFDFSVLFMAEVGTGVLPLRIAPLESTSNSVARSLSINHSQAETYDLSGEPTTGALSTTDNQGLRNQKGYLPVSWMEARTQIRCTLALMGALCGPEHPITVGWRCMLRQYNKVEALLMHDMDEEVGPSLAPSLFVLHLQLILRDWFVEQTMTRQRITVAAPDIGQYLKVFERQNNLQWIPSMTDIPSLLALRAPAVSFQPCVPASAHRPVAASPSPAGGATSPPSAPTERRELGARDRNAGRDSRFTGNTAFAKNARNRRV